MYCFITKNETRCSINLCTRVFYIAGLQQKDVLCDLCGQAFPAKNQMQRHRMIHNEAYRQRFKCIYCTYNTYTRPNIRRHMLSVHKDLPYEEITSDYVEPAQDV